MSNRRRAIALVCFTLLAGCSSMPRRVRGSDITLPDSPQNQLMRALGAPCSPSDSVRTGGTLQSKCETSAVPGARLDTLHVGSPKTP